MVWPLVLVSREEQWLGRLGPQPVKERQRFRDLWPRQLRSLGRCFRVNQGFKGLRLRFKGLRQRLALLRSLGRCFRRNQLPLVLHLRPSPKGKRGGTLMLGRVRSLVRR